MTTLQTTSPIAPLLLTDGYKLDHRRQYPAGTTRVYSNFTNRASRIPGVDRVVHFGLQAFCRRVLVEAFARFFAADEDVVAAEYRRVLDVYLGPNEIGTDHIRALHRRGCLPLRICAVPEGTRVPLRVPSFTIENTDPEFSWLVNYLETAISAAVWHPSTTATIADRYRRLLDARAAATGGPAAAVDFQAHDFSFRGQASLDAAAASGAAHLLSFRGSDSLTSLDWIDRYYPGDNGFVAASVPATEHSVMCAGGQEDEAQTYRRLLELYPRGIVSVVSDTWDLWRVITEILPGLREQIVGRDGKLVVRPDSGDPADILCGDRTAEPGTPAAKGVVRLLHELFGGTVNPAGFVELDPHIGAIYGDSITLARAEAICDRLAAAGYASTNVVFGIGSFTYQYVTRDTFSSAIKATWVEVGGQGRNLRKDPVTDNGTKRSATGRLAVASGPDGELTLIEQASAEQERASLLRPVWEDGKPVRTQSFADVRRVLAEGAADA
ncbi:nicotinate phosphoribosyltransferase [Rhodococcus sp. D2-41]|uniref:Nicotinamide phosphoribosyltransferase n=1 Tax=Speluncibacter jeojiensis TaxID=2710754 RepID=A0A9X4RFA8_9ACTN|nr:nicotinate phosphoribosyltransferase [Rhodococcus sp. D2-41]MDG3009239.1 nicotinate phosphoribosyltransferase [Rhodococcus sp. D2-41]MDG3016087.1 nicotinate phosphoribosyltransferase [Corynebacteriales bacterium D3-21]